MICQLKLIFKKVNKWEKKELSLTGTVLQTSEKVSNE